MIRALAGVVALALAGPTAAQERPYVALPSPVSATCPGGLCQPEGLARFYAALDRHRGAIRIVQFGDSHTAAGDIGRSLAWRLGQRFDRPVRLYPHGIVGATLNALAEREHLYDEGEDAPDLVILAYGTNEGFDELLNPRAYERLLRTQIERVRRASPGTAVLILGAPEAMRGDGGGRCPGDADRRWKPPEMLGVVRDVQHRVATEMGVAFWDWRGRMGGECSAFALAQGDQPLMRGDHVHFTFAGGDWIGSLLAADLIAAYDRRSL